MKFYTVQIPVVVSGREGDKPHRLRIEVTVGDDGFAEEAADKLSAIIQHKLDTVDIGDCE